jgi:hypothetical protein
MNHKPYPRWQEIDELLAFLAGKDREWLARERRSPSGAPNQALRSVALGGPAAFAVLAGLPRDQDPESWICKAIIALRDAEKEFKRADYNDPDCFGSAIFGQVACELSSLFTRWSGRHPQSRYDADQLSLEVLESFDGRLGYWWECFITPYENYPAPPEPVQAAFREMTKSEKVPTPVPTESGLEYLLRARAHYQMLTRSMDATIAEAAVMAVEEVDRVIAPVTGIVAKPRASPLLGNSTSVHNEHVKFTLFTEDDLAWSPWRHRLLRLMITCAIGALAAWILVNLVYTLRD